MALSVAIWTQSNRVLDRVLATVSQSRDMMHLKKWNAGDRQKRRALAAVKTFALGTKPCESGDIGIPGKFISRDLCLLWSARRIGDSSQQLRFRELHRGPHGLVKFLRRFHVDPVPARTVRPVDEFLPLAFTFPMDRADRIPTS